MMISEKEKNFISAVVYVYNDEKHIVEFVERLYRELELHFLKFEIICVNDCSDDAGMQRLKEKAESLSRGVISIVNMSFHQGLELSMNAGVDLSIGDFIFEFDKVDLSLPMDNLMSVYAKALEGNDIVSLSPRKNNGFWSNAFYNIFNAYSNKNYPLHSESYHLISRRAINRCQSLSKTIPYRKAVYADCGLKVANISSEQATSCTHDEKRFDTAVDALILFTNAAVKMNLYVMGLFMLLCLAVIAYVLYIYLKGNPVSGWTTTMLFMSFGFLSIFVLLGILMKYMAVIIDLIFKKKTYVTESIEKLTK